MLVPLELYWVTESYWVVVEVFSSFSINDEKNSYWIKLEQWKLKMWDWIGWIGEWKIEKEFSSQRRRQWACKIALRMMKKIEKKKIRKFGEKRNFIKETAKIKREACGEMFSSYFAAEFVMILRKKCIAPFFSHFIKKLFITIYPKLTIHIVNPNEVF